MGDDFMEVLEELRERAERAEQRTEVYGAKLSDALIHIANAKDTCVGLRDHDEEEVRQQALFAVSQLHMAMDDIQRAWDKARS